MSWGVDVSYDDPYVREWTPKGADAASMLHSAGVPAAADEVDLIILLQPHPEYDLAAIASSPVSVLDTRGVLPVGSTVTVL